MTDTDSLSRPREVKDLLLEAVSLHQQGKFAEAKDRYENILALRPDQADAWHLLGVISGQCGHHSEAVESIDRAIALNPREAMFFTNRGISLRGLQRLTEALADFDHALELKADHAPTHNNRGNVLRDLGRLEEALASYDRAIRLRPNYAEALSHRGTTLTDLERFGEALASHNQAIALKPDYADAYLNRGNTLKELKRLEEALEDYDRAISLNPLHAQAFYNRGGALQELGQSNKALRSYDQAIAISQGMADAHWNKGLLLLQVGQFAQGWRLYEWRWATKHFESSKRSFTCPLWRGADDLAGKTILLHSEQGFGDTIQFSRYAKRVKALGARVVLEVPKALIPLMQTLEGVDDVIERGQSLPSFDFHCPLLSLPLAFETDLSSIPGVVPYLKASAQRTHRWREYLGTDGFKIAICWQGKPTSKVDVGRSFPVTLFEGLAKIDTVRLISLQKNDGSEQLKNLPKRMKVETLPDDFDGEGAAFLDSAAVMECVDLVITSDTALTHLAGALGVENWTPLKHLPDWRWMLERHDSPWYPNHRLFRQRTPGDWQTVFQEMEAALRDRLAIR